MSALDSLLESVKNSILTHIDQGGHRNFDTGGLLGKITDLFGEHKTVHGPGPSGISTKPASQDPYGDPGDQSRAPATAGGNIKSATEDPYGDPADESKR